MRNGLVKKCLHLWVLVLTVSLLVNSFAVSLGEKETWDCSNCGKQGNKGSFCGGCGSPGPWKVNNKE